MVRRADEVAYLHPAVAVLVEMDAQPMLTGCRRELQCAGPYTVVHSHAVAAAYRDPHGHADGHADEHTGAVLHDHANAGATPGHENRPR